MTATRITSLEKTKQFTSYSCDKMKSRRSRLICIVLIVFMLISRTVQLSIIGKYHNGQGQIGEEDSEDILEDVKSERDYKNWVLGDPVPFESIRSSNDQKQNRLKRSIHREKVPKFSLTNISPYSSIVFIAVGCIGTLISPVHVLTAAHCVHDGRRERNGPLMNPLKVGLIRRNGKQHKIRVKKIFVSREIKPNTGSRFAYDYAVLKLVRPHRRPYLDVKATSSDVRALTFHVFEWQRSRRALIMYKYSHCPVMNKNAINAYKILAKDCPSSVGDSGTAVFDSSEGNTIIGLLSASARYRTRSGGHYHVTVILKLTDLDVMKIKHWVRTSS